MKMLITDSREIYKENIPEGTIIIRRAIEDDIDALINISRISFPDQLIWCTENQAKKTWEHFIKSEFQEVWVCQFNNEVVAVIRLEKDVSQCNREIKALKPGLQTVLCILILRPRLLFEKVLEKFIFLLSKNAIYSDRIETLGKNSIWCHSSAVLPKMRNKGIGSKMMSFCEQRGLELGYDSIKFFIKTTNKGSIRLHERLGFIRAGKVKDQYLYIKLFSK
jgi:ribosomal protein S18 acetylase RimI-like enzyme